MRFQDGCERYLISNQLTMMTLERTPMTKYSEVTIVYVIHDETIDLEKGHYHGV